MYSGLCTAHTPRTGSILASSTAHISNTRSFSATSTAIVSMLAVRNALDTPSILTVSSILGAPVQYRYWEDLRYVVIVLQLR